MSFRFIVCFFLVFIFSGFAKSKDSSKESLRTLYTGLKKETKSPKKEFSLIVNDPLIQKKWDLSKIQAKQAWLNFSKGSRNIVVAVIDTGIDVNHPDLKANIWTNTKEIPGNKIDDDKNGFVDDLHGWNFVGSKGKYKGNNRVFDTHGHGTHIAGIIGAVGGNGIGLSGVAPKVSLMALKYYNPADSGSDNLNNTVKAIHYAIENGADIINYSGGGLSGNKAEKEAIELAEKKGVLFVAASGNERSNMDKKKYYPASYGLSNILSVTATNPSDNILSSSNWGKSTLESAPGIDILSTLPGGKYGRMTGTSQATAVATGAAVLIMDYYKMKAPSFVIKQLEMTGDWKHSLTAKTSQGRRINIHKALAMRGKKLDMRDQAVKGSSVVSVHPHSSSENLKKRSAMENEMPREEREWSEIQWVNKTVQQSMDTSAFTDSPAPDLMKPNSMKPMKEESLNRKPSSVQQNRVSILKRWHLP